MENNLMTLTEGKTLSEVFDSIKEIHSKVSEIITPQNCIKNKMGMKYVEYDYMRLIADENYPGWSWEVINTQLIGDKAFMVHGRLKWIDCGLPRTGDTTAAHRIQKKKSSDEYVDIGNDIKSANTDCIKKAFNMFMNIADDIYDNQVEDVTLTEEEINTLHERSSFDATLQGNIKIKIEKGDITKLNYEASLRRVKKLSEEYKTISS